MKKYINIAIIYAAFAMAGGVFYREFTKFSNFTGTTALGKVHTHLFMLGMFFFLLVGLFSVTTSLTSQKSFKAFLVLYNIGVVVTAVMLLVRGVVQVSGFTVSKGLDASISGIAGIGHILTGIGIILFLIALKRAATDSEHVTTPHERA